MQASLYNKITSPPNDKEEAEKQALESQKIIAQQGQLEELHRWLKITGTLKFIQALETLDKNLSNDVILLSGSNEVFNTIGKNKAFECKILRKVINYARTGKYDSE